MSGRRRDFFEGRNTLSTVIFILIVAVLLACMGYLNYYFKQQQQKSQERLAQLKQEESGILESFEKDFNPTEETAKTSTEETTETMTEKTAEESSTDASAADMSAEDTSAEETSKADTSVSKEDASASESSSEKSSDAVESESDGQMSSASAAETPIKSGTAAENTKPAHPVRAADPNAAKKEISVIVLNGTRKDGVAGYWKDRLQTEGFEQIVAATYKAAIEKETVLYVAEKKQAEYFKRLFPNAKVEVGSLESLKRYITVAADQDALDTYDVWVVVGMNDARAE